MVVGGGVGGIFAAAVAAKRGHDVTLFESTDTLGGQMRLSSIILLEKEILQTWYEVMLAKCESMELKLHINTAVTPEIVSAEAPEAVIIATGSIPLVLPIPGINDSGLIHAVDLLDGKEACGKKVLVVGGGMVGAETADFLGEQGHDVTVIELRDEVGGRCNF